MIKKFVFCFLSSVLCLISSAFAADVNQPSKFTHTSSPTGFIKAFSWGWAGERGTYAGPNAVDSMKKMTETGANWVCISFAGEMMKPNDPGIIWADDDPCMVTDDEIRRAIDLAARTTSKSFSSPW